MSVYVVGVSYIDTDGSVNEDPTAGEFRTEAEAYAFVQSLKDNSDVIDIWVSSSDTPL